MKLSGLLLAVYQQYCIEGDPVKQTLHANKRRSLLYAVPALAVMAAIFLLSSRTGDEINRFLPWFQKLFPAMSSFDWGHFMAYFVLALAFDYGFGTRADSWGMKILIVALCGLYGLTDEYHQSFVGGRTPDLQDIRNDCIGGAIAMAVTAIPAVRRRWRKITS